MEIIIQHKRTKREINEAFAICCGKDELKQLKAIIDSELENGFSFGWVYIDEFITQSEDSDFNITKRQKNFPNTKPIAWESEPLVISTNETITPVCQKCQDRGWLYDEKEVRTRVCPCHF